MNCPTCGRRSAHRACPALGHDICSVCCATKRLVEIRCPDTCRYLVSSQRHPPAAMVRQRENDYLQLVELTRDYSDRQAAVFVLVNQTLLALGSAGLDRLIDDDVAEAAGALAATLETAAKGLIYEQRPASLPAARVADALRPVLTRAGEGRGSAFERDAAVVLRGIERLARDLARSGSSDEGGYLALIRRTIGASPGAERPDAAEPPRLILP